MPELPDIIYLEKKLSNSVIGTVIKEVKVFNPIVLRVLTAENFVPVLQDRTIESITHRGPFLLFSLGEVELILNFMLAGQLYYTKGPPKKSASHCFSITLDTRMVLTFADKKHMGKVYVTPKGDYEKIPGLEGQGINITSGQFTYECFSKLIGKKRCQVRVFLMDQTLLSAIGNAYADEILFAAGIHPKKRCNDLTPEEKETLYQSVKEVITRGIEEVEKAGKELHVKVRDHMKVRGKKGQNCPVCGTVIRRETVHGYDTFYCPGCQKAGGLSGLPWDS